MARILVVDDDPDICDLLDLTLRADGHEVTVEHDGEAALAAASTAPVDLVLLDWMMPRMSGLDVCRALRGLPGAGHLPVIVLTARARESDVREGLQAGADDYVVKPFSPRNVAARVRSVLAAAAGTPAPPGLEGPGRP